VLAILKARKLVFADPTRKLPVLPTRTTITLAGPARVRLAAWLDHRARKWLRTLNPYLFVTQQTVPRLGPPGHQSPWKQAGLNPRALRTDRILQGVRETGGDARRICDLFGLTIDTAMRYAATLGHPALREQAPRRSTS